jgi:hypothetical protein
LTCLECLVMSEVDFGLTGMAWNRGSLFLACLVRSPQSMVARKDKESGCDVLYLYISFVLSHGRELAMHKENSTLC